MTFSYRTREFIRVLNECATEGLDRKAVCEILHMTKWAVRSRASWCRKRGVELKGFRRGRRKQA